MKTVAFFEVINEGRKKLNQVFKELRRQGLIARQNFTCCSTCGNYEGWQEVERRGKRGLVFYHRQDVETLEKGYVYLAFCGGDEAPYLSTIQVGELVMEILQRYGLQVEWNKDPGTRIKVIFNQD